MPPSEPGPRQVNLAGPLRRHHRAAHSALIVQEFGARILSATERAGSQDAFG